MKRIVLALCLLLTFCILSTAAVVSAQVDPLEKVCAENPNATVCQDNQSDGNKDPLFGPSGVLTKAMTILVRIVGVAAVIGVVVAGATMTFAGGDSQQAATARSALIYCLIGLVVAITAQLIVSFVLQKL